MMSSRRHQYPYDTHHGVVINRAKFDACTSSSFTGVKTDTPTDRIALYRSILDLRYDFFRLIFLQRNCKHFGTRGYLWRNLLRR